MLESTQEKAVYSAQKEFNVAVVHDLQRLKAQIRLQIGAIMVLFVGDLILLTAIFAVGMSR